MRSLLIFLAACGATAHPRPKLGTIAGLVRDSKTGDYLAAADIEVGGQHATSEVTGLYQVDGLAPGTYSLHAKYAGQPVTINNIDVSKGMATFVDIPFSLGDPAPSVIDWGNPKDGEIQHFTTAKPRIEGTLNDTRTRERVAGAVVTASSDVDSLQTVTDDQGRYRFDSVAPGTYTVSAYYSIGGRGQMELRRSDVEVKTGEGVLVPLWIELAK